MARHLSEGDMRHSMANEIAAHPIRPRPASQKPRSPSILRVLTLAPGPACPRDHGAAPRHRRATTSKARVALRRGVGRLPRLWVRARRSGAGAVSVTGAGSGKRAWAARPGHAGSHRPRPTGHDDAPLHPRPQTDVSGGDARAGGGLRSLFQPWLSRFPPPKGPGLSFPPAPPRRPGRLSAHCNAPIRGPNAKPSAKDRDAKPLRLCLLWRAPPVPDPSLTWRDLCDPRLATRAGRRPGHAAGPLRGGRRRADGGPWRARRRSAGGAKPSG